MLHYIKGKITDTFDGGIVIENGGIGYELYVPSSSALYLAREDEVVTAYTAMLVREDDISLYGFDDRESLVMFRLLTTVSGIGAKAGISILSALSVSEIKKALVFNDPDAFARAQGVGKKTAQRIVLELKDKVDASTLVEPAAGKDAALGAATGTRVSGVSEAIDALIMLGYTKSEAAEAIAASGIEDGSTEEYIKAALKRLSRF